jgi:proteasome lid subunit RPN8/RPN11
MSLESLAAEVFAHAEKEQPRECCGLAVVVKGRLRYRPCKNISLNAVQFEIDPDDYASADDAGEVVGVCHSHVFISPEPSEADRVMCEHTNVPWLIVNYPTGNFKQIEPTGYQAPLIGRSYAHGVLDCYQIIVDFYQREYDIALPYFARQDDWWHKGESLYMNGFSKAGFVQLGDGTFKELEPGDVLLIQMASPVPNHAAIYLGDNLILQHVAGRLSSRDIYGGYWRKSTTHVLRHRSKI